MIIIGLIIVITLYIIIRLLLVLNKKRKKNTNYLLWSTQNRSKIVKSICYGQQENGNKLSLLFAAVFLMTAANALDYLLRFWDDRNK